MSEFDIRELSKAKWTTKETHFDALNCGSLLRIADALEQIAMSKADLERDVERLMAENAELLKDKARLEFIVASSFRVSGPDFRQAIDAAMEAKQ